MIVKAELASIYFYCLCCCSLLHFVSFGLGLSNGPKGVNV